MNLALVQSGHRFEQVEGPDVPDLRAADDLQAVRMEDPVHGRVQLVQLSVDIERSTRISNYEGSKQFTH